MDAKTLIASRVAQELKDGDVVNLGIGLPTLIPNYLPPGINITLQSYADRICFGVMGAPEQVGDLRPFIGHLGAALAEVVAAVEASASEQPAPRTRRATASRPD